MKKNRIKLEANDIFMVSIDGRIFLLKRKHKYLLSFVKTLPNVH